MQDEASGKDYWVVKNSWWALRFDSLILPCFCQHMRYLATNCMTAVCQVWQLVSHVDVGFGIRC